MIVPVAVALTFLLTIPGPVQEQSPNRPAEEIAALLAEHEESELGFVEAYHAFRPRFEEFVKTHRGTEAEVGATLWLVKQSWWLRSDGEMETTSVPLAEGLLERHPKSSQLGLLVEYKYVFKKDQRKTLFTRLLEVTPHREVEAAAHFGLAQLEPARLEDGAPNPHYAAILAKYAEVPWRLSTFGSIADAYLNPHPQEALTVGKLAPEIEGIDEHGEPMKLSDYRGKVVLLDFWGDW